MGTGAKELPTQHLPTMPEHVPTVDEILADTAIGCGLHRWEALRRGGSYRDF